METFGKRIGNFLRNLVWYMDYLIFQTINLFNKKKIDLKKIKRIIIVELLYIGDIIAITPIIRVIKQNIPQAKIDIMLRPKMVDVLKGNPHVNKIFPCDKDDFKNFKELVKKVQKQRYDLAILLHPGIDIGNYKVSKLLKESKIPFRIGCTKVGFLEGKGFFLHRKTKPTFKTKHKIYDNLDVIKTLGIRTKEIKLELYTSKESEERIKKFLKKEGIKNNYPKIIIHASPQHKSHRWIIERFAKVADKLIQEYNAQIIFSGAKKDKDYNQKIITEMLNKAINLSGKTSIQEFFALVKNSDLLISVDTSAMHVAAAFGVPVIALFGAGNPKIWKPYSKKTIVLFKDEEVCTSCMKHKCKKNHECMKAIKEEDVLEAVKKLNLRKFYIGSKHIKFRDMENINKK